MIEERNSKYKKIRESFHSIPELAFQEIETTKLIIKYLEETKGFNEHADITLTGKSGLIVTIPRKTKKPLIAFRADIDGLPICEKSQSQIKSKYPNQMHACGHDSHITIIIAIIEIMLENISKIERSVYGLRFIFQPAEEIGEGALEMINKYNCLANVEEIYGIHNVPELYIKDIGTIDGTMMSRVDKYVIELSYDNTKDKSDIIVGGCNLINLINQIKSEGIFAITCFNENDENKVIDIKGTLRSLTNEAADIFIEKLNKICKAFEILYNIKCNINLKSTHALINEKLCTDNVLKLTKENGYSINQYGLPSPSSDDFAFYLEKVKGCYIGFGTAETKEEALSNHVHSSKFIYNDNATVSIVNFLKILIQDRLSVNFQK